MIEKRKNTMTKDNMLTIQAIKPVLTAGTTSQNVAVQKMIAKMAVNTNSVAAKEADIRHIVNKKKVSEEELITTLRKSASLQSCKKALLY